MRRLFLAISIFISFNCVAIDLPDGWRLPTTQELSGVERNIEYNLYSSSNRFSKAEADFNGDKKIDSAFILISEQFNGDGLFVYLSTPNGYIWLPLSIDNWDKAYPEQNYIYSTPIMGIGSLSPEIAKTYVKDARFESPEGNPKNSELNNHVLDFFRFKSAGSFYYWVASENKFKRFRYSD